MQISQVLKRKCRAESELEFFLYIQQLSQAIELATPRFIMLTNAGVNPLDIKEDMDIETAETNKEMAVRELHKFGLTDPVVTKLKHVKAFYSLEFRRWYTWWEEYLNSLNEVELCDLEKAYINGESLLEWYPKGSWKDIL